MNELVAYCDGGSRGNPGPAALGVSVQTLDGDEIESIAETIGETTNNVAEYTAVLRALRRVLELGTRRVTIRTDSELLVRQLRGTYKVRSSNLKPLHAQIVAAGRAFESVTYEHVPRERNERADELVNLALDAGG